MDHRIDSWIVALYFAAIFSAGYILSRRFRKKSAEEFITGRGTTNWWQAALTIVAMAVDPSVMGLGGLGFLWGFYLFQWTGVHVWFTAWFAAMFFVPIYWRTGIYTTPEYLEQRFNVQCRAFFSVVMIAIMIATLASGLFLGTLLLKNLLGWSQTVSLVVVCAVVGFYVIMGGMRTVLTLDVYQSLFLLATLAAIPLMALYKYGGLTGLASINIAGDAGTRLVSVTPPSDWSLTTGLFFPWQAVVTWAAVAGLSWLICNFAMAQRLLAARSERDAQKALMLVGVLSQASCFSGYITGVFVRANHPGILPDEALMTVILTLFPAGVRGLLTAGFMAALLSTADGMLTASGTLFSQDIYLRFLRPGAGERERKLTIRLVQGITLLVAVALFPFVVGSASVMTFLQSFYGDVLGVVVALYLVGIFSRRAAPRAAFASMIAGIVLAVVLDVFTPINFAYVGFLSFLFAGAATLLFSRLERPVPPERLVNLTVHTLSGIRGPWVGLAAWPDLWKWALGIASGWIFLSVVWEWYIRHFLK